ncbi:MAG: hypothetical protein AAGF11_42905 [Myxococcota bacterium]
MRWLGIFAIAAASFWGCSLEDALEGAPCNSTDDCVGEQACVKAPAADVGECRSDGRLPSDQVENNECDDDSSCGAGFVCTRTLEQQQEQQEQLPENQAVEPGWCRPAETPECVQSEQVGCRTDGSCSGVDLRFTSNCTSTGRCYCCGDPASSDFNVHVYADTAMGESAACVGCSKSACETGTTTCTVLEDPDCQVSAGSVCGCTMPP